MIPMKMDIVNIFDQQKIIQCYFTIHCIWAASYFSNHRKEYYYTLLRLSYILSWTIHTKPGGSSCRALKIELHRLKFRLIMIEVCAWGKDIFIVDDLTKITTRVVMYSNTYVYLRLDAQSICVKSGFHFGSLYDAYLLLLPNWVMPNRIAAAA